MLQSVYSPRIEETAAANVRAGSGGWLRSWSRERRLQKLRRDALATLLRVDSDILRDITGLERHQVVAAAKLPLEVDALDRLRRMRDIEMADAVTSPHSD
ncbi:hypothetical protein [Jiella mangrovi]|uniref:DUF1127 domain-containing protein n=1 Tax=Jiella mangrovi TaxID=2821407 RepID=A0ABS4BDF8_9HYPH|nr:hypothetical protein [Jiella mangrovi]MBP0614792.1 hypothetical protein [Jiella mangrovi]